MGHHVERVQEADVVEDPSVHVVRHRVVLHPAERQGHVGARTLQAGGQPAGRTGETGETDGGEISEHVVLSLQPQRAPTASPASFKKSSSRLLGTSSRAAVCRDLDPRGAGAEKVVEEKRHRQSPGLAGFI